MLFSNANDLFKTCYAVVPSGFIILTTFITTLAVVNDRAKDLTYANALAENKIESVRSLGFTALSDGTTDFTSELPDTIAEPRSATYVVSSPNSSLKQIDVNITYNDHGETRTINYVTYVGELGITQ